ncbi:ATP phosphoribosyltransferase regulatory subunit, partial [bacterium]|nr:ATP phosphoribosyltransferase regulatory subunit [candidate division CSSED10-310 bacterium]
GGRYDGLVGNFLGREIPATGSSLGIERIFDVMREFDMLPPIPTATDVLVTVFDEAARSASLEIARLLRGAAVNVETYIGPTKKGYRKQLGYANDKRIPLVVLAGPDELDAGTVTVKRMTAAPDRQEQLTVPRDRLIETVRNLLG